MNLLRLATAQVVRVAEMIPSIPSFDRALGPRGCLFTFHRAVPPALWNQLPNRNFYVDIEFLERFLAYLVAQNWKVVTISEALRRSADPDDDSRFVNFSIDDCYRDTFELIVPLFRRYNLPVTLFVTTGVPDGTLPLWWAGLEDALQQRDRVVLPGQIVELGTSEQRSAAFHQIAASWDGPDAGKHYAGFCASNQIDSVAMHWKHAISWAMLAELAQDPLVEIGAHTVSHPRISALTPTDARTELETSRQRLNERLGINVAHFAFPYGRSGDCGPRDFSLARDAGYRSAATTRKGLLRQGRNEFNLPRNTINGGHRSIAAMQMHLTGLAGAAARIVGRV